MSSYITPVRGLLLELLKCALHQGQEGGINFPNEISQQMWQQCYTLACEQGVMALAWQGVMKLPVQMQPPKNIKIVWALAVEKYGQKYSRYCATAQQLSDFYKENSISTTFLKGVGYSSLYPYPQSREGGDLDIYTYSATPNLTDKEANTEADELMSNMGIEVDTSGYKHSNFFYNNIPIENHKNFLNIEHWRLAKRYNPLLIKYLNPQLTPLLGGEYAILTPSAEFNSLFISFHTAQHLTSGIKLHHICDWAVLLNKFGNRLPKEVDDAKYLKWVDSLTYICNQYFGTNGEYLTDENNVYTDLILKEAFEPTFDSGKIPGHPVRIFIFKCKRFFYSSKVMNDLLGNTIYRAFWRSLIFHVKSPETILKVK